MRQAGAQAAREGSLSLSELRTLYLDLLRRPPFDEERRKFSRDLVRWSGADDPGMPGQESPGPVDRPGKSAQLVATGEFWRQWYEEQLYYFLLIDNFAPKSEAMLAIPDELAAGKLDVRDAIHRIALSSSFDQRNPGADTFVTVVMEQLAGLAVEKNRRELEIGKAVYDGRAGKFLGLAATTQSDVVRAAIEQRSFAESFLAREHRRLVHVEPRGGDLRAWTDRFVADPRSFPELVRSWIDSAVYRARLARREPMDNRLFVRALFCDVLGRTPTEEEFGRMRSALDGLSDPAPLRAVLARLLIDTERPKSKRPELGRPDGAGKSEAAEPAPPEEPSKLVEREFERLLGRAPADAERAALVDALTQPGARPELLTYALVTSAEYQSY